MVNSECMLFVLTIDWVYVHEFILQRRGTRAQKEQNTYAIPIKFYHT